MLCASSWYNASWASGIPCKESHLFDLARSRFPVVSRLLLGALSLAAGATPFMKSMLSLSLEGVSFTVETSR